MDQIRDLWLDHEQVSIAVHASMHHEFHRAKQFGFFNDFALPSDEQKTWRAARASFSEKQLPDYHDHGTNHHADYPTSHGEIQS
jgi:hypothetical protein